MKKKLIGVAVVAAMAVTAGWNYNQSQNEVELSDLALTNVEALASGETNTTWDCEGWWGDCSAHCGACNTKVEGDGSIKGSHSCNN